jgi:hypothetical protein
MVSTKRRMSKAKKNLRDIEEVNARSTTMLPGKRGRGCARRSTSCGQHGLTRLAVRCRGRNESLATLTIRFDASALSSRLESVRF